ncbi:lysozyme [Coniochaeta sp. 2T2.1]|nr:lysozyme [Coniochaeta sp. 2T2.1]
MHPTISSASTLLLLFLPLVLTATPQTCTITTGQSGVCISTSSCTSGGGVPEAGHCTGSAANIQCCTYGPCNVATFCPGGEEVQCCVPGTATVGGRPCGAFVVNQATLELVKGFEGWFPDIYDDPDGHATVGWGHLCDDRSCSDVPYPIPLSEADGQRLLLDDLAIAERCISDMIVPSVTLNPNQYGALVSWAFNVGCGAARSSTLVSRLNAGQDPNTVAREELPRWNRGDNGVLPGLTRRRAAEVVLFTTPAAGVALPMPC